MKVKKRRGGGPAGVSSHNVTLHSPRIPRGKAAARWLRAKLSFNDILRGADVIICGDLDDPRKHRIKSEGGYPNLEMDRNRQPGTAD
jgi:hypothetical protein